MGPVEVVADGCPVAVGAGRERAVLARLLASANHVVAQETLVNDLWPDESPERAAQAVWVYVSRLRKALRTAGGDDVLVTRPPGYLLVVDPAAFDAARFEALAGDGHRAAREGRHGDAAATLTEALRLWRGPAYAGVTELPFARAEAARLEEARLGALETRVDAELACGRDAELIGELASLTEEYPLRERLWALRITALYRAGRQAEALLPTRSCVATSPRNWAWNRPGSFGHSKGRSCARTQAWPGRGPPAPRPWRSRPLRAW